MVFSFNKIYFFKKKVAAYIAIFYKEKVDIITLTDNIAFREFKKMEEFYSQIGLKSRYLD